MVCERRGFFFVYVSKTNTQPRVMFEKMNETLDALYYRTKACILYIYMSLLICVYTCVVPIECSDLGINSVRRDVLEAHIKEYIGENMHVVYSVHVRMRVCIRVHVHVCTYDGLVYTRTYNGMYTCVNRMHTYRCA
jgi:hypothetical protein